MTITAAALIQYLVYAGLAVVPALVVHLYHKGQQPGTKPMPPANPPAPAPVPAVIPNMDNHPVVQSILRALSQAPIVQVPGHPGLTMAEEDLQAVLKDLVTLKTSMAKLNPPAIAPPANLTEK